MVALPDPAVIPQTASNSFEKTCPILSVLGHEVCQEAQPEDAERVAELLGLPHQDVVGYAVEGLDEVQQALGVGRFEPRRRFCPCRLLPSRDLCSIAFAGIEVAAVVPPLQRTGDVAAGSHPDVREDREQSDRAEATVGLREEAYDDQLDSLRPPALLLAADQQLEQCLQPFAMSSPQCPRMHLVPSKPGRGGKGHEAVEQLGHEHLRRDGNVVHRVECGYGPVAFFADPPDGPPAVRLGFALLLCIEWGDQAALVPSRCGKVVRRHAVDTIEAIDIERLGGCDLGGGPAHRRA